MRFSLNDWYRKWGAGQTKTGALDEDKTYDYRGRQEILPKGRMTYQAISDSEEYMKILNDAENGSFAIFQVKTRTHDYGVPNHWVLGYKAQNGTWYNMDHCMLGKTRMDFSKTYQIKLGVSRREVR